MTKGEPKVKPGLNTVEWWEKAEGKWFTGWKAVPHRPPGTGPGANQG